MKKKIIYICCPAYSKSGGPELLHQLLFSLNRLNKKAVIAYFGIENDRKDSPCNEDFKEYLTNGSWISINEIEDKKENVLIVPETNISLLKNYQYITKVIWWLSVDNFLKVNNFFYNLKNISIKNAFGKTIKKLLGENKFLINNADLNLCQSFYAIKFLKSNHIESKKILYLSDYVNDYYLKESDNIDRNETKRDNIVFYNPAKGFKFTRKIIKQSNMHNLKIRWVAIKNMTNYMILENFKRGKVYIDFGNHPGKDRLPREAAILGCCVITGKRGSAKFQEDVAIPHCYKFDDKNIEVNNIVNRIYYCLNNYSKASNDFLNYRNKIKQEKTKFLVDVKSFSNIIDSI